MLLLIVFLLVYLIHIYVVTISRGQMTLSFEQKGHFKAVKRFLMFIPMIIIRVSLTRWGLVVFYLLFSL